MDYEVHERSKVEGIGAAAVPAEQQISHGTFGVDDEP
jgi:hypothetical protein